MSSPTYLPRAPGDIEVARLTRGKVPAWDDSYIEQMVPKEILQKMHAGNWVDTEGFFWGFEAMCAATVRTGENVVVVASKHLGQGETLVKVVVPDTSILTVHACDLA